MRALKPNVYSVGAIDWDARLFDRLIPLPEGTSYNSYMVKASQKTVLLDTVDPAAMMQVEAVGERDDLVTPLVVGRHGGNVETRHRANTTPRAAGLRRQQASRLPASAARG